jgi:plasmid stabilization system protein ParE
MPLRVRIAARAAGQVRGADAWWRLDRPLAPGALSENLEGALALLVTQPGIGTRCAGARAAGVRRLYLGRVGYFLYYRADSEVLDVLAFWHGRRAQQPVL